MSERDYNSPSSGYENGGYRERNYDDQSRGQNDRRDNYGGGSNRSYGGSGSQSQGGYRNNYSGGNRSGGYRGNRAEKKNPEDIKLYIPAYLTSNSDAPEHIGRLFVEIGERLKQAGYTIRTTGLEGPDIETAKIPDAEVYIPWKGFRGIENNFSFPSDESKILAIQFQPAFRPGDRLPEGDDLRKTFMAFLSVNIRALQGQRMNSPASLLIVWSKDGCEHARNRSAETGNVGHAISVASAMHIPIFNLNRSDAKDRLYRFLGIE